MKLGSRQLSALGKELKVRLDTEDVEATILTRSFPTRQANKEYKNNAVKPLHLALTVTADAAGEVKLYVNGTYVVARGYIPQANAPCFLTAVINPGESYWFTSNASNFRVLHCVEVV
jgi:hypothetical protein